MADFSSDRRPCKFCGQSIEIRSVRCIYCLREVQPDAAGQSLFSKIILLGSVAYLVAVPLWLQHSNYSYQTSSCSSSAVSMKEIDRRLPSEPISSGEQQSNYNDQMINGAIDEWTRAIAKNPKNATAFLERGWAYAAVQEYDNAIYDLTRAIALAPKSSDAYIKRAWVYDTMGEYLKSVKDATSAIQIDPHNNEAYGARAAAYASLGDVERADKDSRRAERTSLN